jgi:hypothetical protein
LNFRPDFAVVMSKRKDIRYEASLAYSIGHNYSSVGQRRRDIVLAGEQPHPWRVGANAEGLAPTGIENGLVGF